MRTICLPTSFTRYSVVMGNPANRRMRARLAPMIGFRARPTWIGPVGFTLVCWRRTRSWRGSPAPYDSPASRRARRVSDMRATGSTRRFTYPPVAVAEVMNRPLGIAGARREAIASGGWCIRWPYTKHPNARSPRASSGSSHGTEIGGRFTERRARARRDSASARTSPHGSRVTSRHPVPEDRGDPAERLHQELPLVGVRGDQLDLRVRAVREGAERVHDVRLRVHDEFVPAVRALRERRLVRDGPGLLVAAVRAADLEPELPEDLGDQERVHVPQVQGPPYLVIAI